MKAKIEVEVQTIRDVVEYLKDHEGDICSQTNDFGDLRGLFIDFFGEEPVSISCRLR